MTRIPRTNVDWCLNVYSQNDIGIVIVCAPIDLVIIFGVFLFGLVSIAIHTFKIALNRNCIVIRIIMLGVESAFKKILRKYVSRRFVCVCKAKLNRSFLTQQKKQNKTNNRHLPMMLNGNLPTPQNLPINGACSSRPS